VRIISGKFKGHRIKSVPNMKTRPTGDKIKESLFHYIGPYFDGGKGLDLFAGSGNIGIEALSRGLDFVIFVDQQYKAVETIKDNLKTLKMRVQYEVYRNDAFRALKALSKRDIQFQYVFLDPPYKTIDFEKLLLQLDTYQLLENGSLIICEHAQDEKLPQRVENYKIMKHDCYNSLTCITFYRYEN